MKSLQLVFVKTRKEVITLEPTRWIEFGIKDKWGASAGLLIYRSIENYVADKEEGQFFIPEGIHYVAQARTARDAKPFGPINVAFHGNAREERERWIDGHIRMTRARFLSLKRHGKL